MSSHSLSTLLRYLCFYFKIYNLKTNKMNTNQLSIAQNMITYFSFRFIKIKLPTVILLYKLIAIFNNITIYRCLLLIYVSAFKLDLSSR